MADMNVFLKTSILAATTILVLGPFLMAAPAASDQSSILTASCTSCHSLKRTCAKLGADQKSWQSTLDRMQAKGSGLSDRQNTNLAEFLATATIKTADFCQ